MEIYIHSNGSNMGPYSLEQLKDLGISPDTPVWYNGLPDWTPAGVAPATRELFFAPSPDKAIVPAEPPAEAQATSASGESAPPVPGSQQGYNPNQGYYGRQGYNPQGYPYGPGQQGPPPSYLAWAIISTLCCCMPFGIVAIIYASKVNGLWLRGDVNGAYKASARAQTWTILAIVIGLLANFFVALLNPMFLGAFL